MGQWGEYLYHSIHYMYKKGKYIHTHLYIST